MVGNPDSDRHGGAGVSAEAGAHEDRLWQRMSPTAKMRKAWSDAAAKVLSTASVTECARCGKDAIAFDGSVIQVAGFDAVIHADCFIRWMRSVEPEAFDALAGDKVDARLTKPSNLRVRFVSGFGL